MNVVKLFTVQKKFGRDPRNSGTGLIHLNYDRHIEVCKRYEVLPDHMNAYFY